jgi:rare lipoprotein A
MSLRGGGSGSVGIGASCAVSRAAAPIPSRPSRGLRFAAVAFTATTLAAAAPWATRAEAPASFLERWWPATESLRTALALAAQGQGVDMLMRPAVPTEPVVAPKRASVSRRGVDGLASYYGSGARTASGERFNARALTAAHRSLPFGTRVRVTNVANGQSVTVRINDRGPFIAGRVIDVSQAAAEELGMVGRGITKVKLDVVE